MVTSFLIAQIFGFSALILSIISITQRNRARFIVYNSLQNIASGMQYLLLDKITAMLLCFISVIRLIIYSFKNKYNLILYTIFLIIFVTFNVFISIVTFTIWYDIFPLIASTLVCFTVWQTNITIIRVGQIIAKVMWGIYAIITSAYFAILMDLFIIIWTIIVIVKSK